MNNKKLRRLKFMDVNFYKEGISKMGVFIKNDLEKMLKEAEKRALTPDKNSPLSTYGSRMKQELATMMSRDKSFGQHLEGTISGGSFILSPFNRLTKKGRAFERTMDEQGNKKYEEQFKAVRHEARNREEHEREPDNPIYGDEYSFDDPEFIQDIEVVDPRGRFATHRGKNDIKIDLVLTGRVFTEEIDKSGRPQRVAVPFGLDTMEKDSINTGQFSDEDNKFIRTEDVDNFHTEWKKRVAEADRINREKLEALGYDLLERGDDGYVEQRVQIDNDPRFIETFPDLTDLPRILSYGGADGKGGANFVPEYDIVIHINGQKVQPHDVDLAFEQLTRKGAYERPGLEAGRDFLIQQGVRGAAFHASVLPQQMAANAIKAPDKMGREGQQVLTGSVLRQIMEALGRGMSR